LGIKWTAPQDFPIKEGILGITSWLQLREFLHSVGRIATPEILIPPELSYPWASPKPEDIEYLEGEDPDTDINVPIIKEILLELLKPDDSHITITDFILLQTNTKMAAAGNTPEELEKIHKGGGKCTVYKYSAVTEWVQKGRPPGPHYGVRTPVWKRPTEYRDAITLHPRTLFEVFELNQRLKRMMSHLKEVGDYTDQHDLLRLAKANYSSWFLTDWKKSGLTIPHWFVDLVVEVINEITPQKRCNFPTKGWGIYDKDKCKWFRPKTFGYGLGMINNVYTLFNIALFKYGQRNGTFEEKDMILSFNDDSAIGTNKGSYEGWLDICRSSGGYLDFHKSYRTNGIQFCEMHQFKQFKSNYKWVTMFTTLTKSVVTCRNLHHCRFQVSEIWDGIRGYDSDISGTATVMAMLGTIEHYIYKFMLSRYEVDEATLPILPPELGGVALGDTFRTQYVLKSGLLLLQDTEDFDTRLRMFKILKASKECFSWRPKYRPWVKFPDGDIKERMLELGAYSGLNSELSAFSMRAQNRFFLDTTWYKEVFWDNFSKEFDKSSSDSSTIIDMWNWAYDQEWHNYAIPDRFVEEKVVYPRSDKVMLPFVRIQKEKPKYSLPSMMVGFINYFERNVPFPEVKIGDVDFSHHLQYEIPILHDVDKYIPICNMETISKIANFNDPRRVFLDYWWRTGFVIKTLNSKDKRSDDALRLVCKLDPNLIDRGFDKCTWYTKYPMPYKSRWSPALSSNLPDMHQDIIRVLYQDDLDPSSFEFTILSDHVDQHRKENPKFWKSRLKSKIKGTQKRKDALGHRAPNNPMDEQEPLSLLNMDDIREVLDSIYSGNTIIATKDEPPQGITYGGLLDLPDDPEWLTQVEDFQDQDQYDFEPEEETEEDLLRAYLDSVEEYDYG
jgi:hypothetical protein